jgi:hypothetical protein
MKRSPAVLALCALVALTAGCCKRQACGGAGPAASVPELAGSPAGFLDRTVTVAGLLSNAGGNYFTDLRLVLSDGGSSAAVRPWLPLEVPPRRPGAGTSRPAVLSDYLGKKVRITGCLRKEGTGYVLEVQQADIIAEGGK